MSSFNHDFSQDPTSDSQAFQDLYAPSNSAEVPLDPSFSASSLNSTWTDPAYPLRSDFPQGIRVDISATQRLPMQPSYPSALTSTPQWSMDADYSPTSASEIHTESSSNYSALQISPDNSFSYYHSDNNLYNNHHLSVYNRQDRSPSIEELVHSSEYSSSNHLSSPSTPSSQHNPSRGESSPGQSPVMQFSSQQGQESQNASSSSIAIAGKPRPLYTHRQQLKFFRDAVTLPIAGYPGMFIPQMMYKPHTNSDRRRYVEEVELEAPIQFWADHPQECGILLSDALHARVKRLVNRDETVFEGRGPSVSIRLEWPGYRPFSRQIPTKDFRSPPGPITRAKLAKNVAKCIQRFILEKHSHPMEDDADPRWRIGTGTGPDRITLDDLILVSLHHVSMGSWQPQLRLRRPI